MEIDAPAKLAVEIVKPSETSTTTTVPESDRKPSQRKLPTYPIDLNYPIKVYLPEDDDALIRSLRAYESGAATGRGGNANGALKSSSEVGKPETVTTEPPPIKIVSKEIILPGVSVIPEYEKEEECRPQWKPKTCDLITFTSPSCDADYVHFETQSIEYELDEEDEMWLEQSKMKASDLDEEGMELLMDILEKESFRQKEFRQLQTEETQYEAEDVPCCVCGERDDHEDNLIMFCDGCNLPIHQLCQDLAEVPEGDWFCDACVYRGRKSKNKKPGAHPEIPVVCILCGMSEGGAFSVTQHPDRLVHIVCALMAPELWFDNGIINTTKLLSERKSLVCSVCQQIGGCVYCSHKSCRASFHALCARENGQLLLFNEPDPNEEADKKAEEKEKENEDAELNESFIIEDDEEEDVEVAVDPQDEAKNDIIPKQAKKKTNKRKKKPKKVKRIPWLPFQILCVQHSALVKAKRLEGLRRKNFDILVDIGRFLEEEDAGDTGNSNCPSHATTFAKSDTILQKLHSKQLKLKRDIFLQVVEYWKAKRLKNRHGHMPFIFQLHVLVSFFKEEFDAGRRYAQRPRQMEILLGQYTAEQKYLLLQNLRASMESLRLMLDIIKKREVRKREAINARVELFEALVKNKFDKDSLSQLYPQVSGRDRSAKTTAVFPFWRAAQPATTRVEQPKPSQPPYTDSLRSSRNLPLRAPTPTDPNIPLPTATHNRPRTELDITPAGPPPKKRRLEPILVAPLPSSSLDRVAVTSNYLGIGGISEIQPMADHRSMMDVDVLSPKPTGSCPWT